MALPVAADDLSSSFKEADRCYGGGEAHGSIAIREHVRNCCQ